MANIFITHDKQKYFLGKKLEITDIAPLD